MPWPEQVLRRFQQIPVNPTEDELWGPYNKLLNVLFPPDSEYTVIPQYLCTPRESSSDFVVIYEVRFNEIPVFVLEINAPNQLRYNSTRAEADNQIRTRIGDLRLDYEPLPVLHGVSAMGTRLRFYKLINNKIDPPSIQADLNRVTDTVPQERWDSDILESEGERRFQAVVEEIKEACAKL